MTLTTQEHFQAMMERELESMELRILESIWCLERSVMDQLEILKLLRIELEAIQKQITNEEVWSSKVQSDKN